MANYANDGNRYTMILIRKPVRGAGSADAFVRAPFDLVRFNVDTQPDAPQYVIPYGGPDIVNQSGTKNESPAIYERIWVTDVLPWGAAGTGRQYFGKVEW